MKKSIFNEWRVIFLVACIFCSIIVIGSVGVKTGLDLKGGVRVRVGLIEPPDISPQQLKQHQQEVASVLRTRLNIYGLSDITIRPWGDRYVLVEAAITTQEELNKMLSLLKSTGKFEAKILNQTILIGADIASVEPVRIMRTQYGRYQWNVPLTLTGDAAKKWAGATQDLPVDPEDPKHLKNTLDIYLDNKMIDELLIEAELAGQTAKRVSVTGAAPTQELATEQGKRMQAILTRKLPVPIEAMGHRYVSPRLGAGFKKGAAIAGLAAVIAVAAAIFTRYREPKVALPIIATCVSEVILILGIAAAIHWTIDLAAIGGIIAAVGTGVDDQIVITDEALRGEIKERARRFRVRLKLAFFIIFSAAATTIGAMTPLLWIYDIRGFALTTIIGVVVGVFITRPTYAKAIEHILA